VHAPGPPLRPGGLLQTGHLRVDLQGDGHVQSSIFRSSDVSSRVR